jgi:hypothetical protein
MMSLILFSKIEIKTSITYLLYQIGMFFLMFGVKNATFMAISRGILS